MYKINKRLIMYKINKLLIIYTINKILKVHKFINYLLFTHKIINNHTTFLFSLVLSTLVANHILCNCRNDLPHIAHTCGFSPVNTSI